MKKILFVDDEPQVLQGIKRMLRGRRNDWDMGFVEGGPQALKRLEQEQFHAIVTDMRMPLIDGAMLLEKVRQKSPSTVRIVLSGHSEGDSIMRLVRPAHQYLAKPVEKEKLEEVLENALNLHDLLSDPGLAELLTQVESLPAMPRIFKQLLEEMESPNCSLKKVGELISSDMGMTTSILKVVNSAFFTLASNVSDPIQAATLLGTDTIKALVLSYQLFSVQGRKNPKILSLEQLWAHSLTTGGFARAIAKHEHLSREEIDESFLAGIMHDVGKLTLMTVTGERYATVVDRVRQGEGFPYEMEKEVLGTTHSEAGAYLLGLWGFTSTVIQAIGMHHQPQQCSSSGDLNLLTLIHVANALEHELVVIHPNYIKTQLDMDFLEALGLKGHIETWRSVCQELMQNGVADANGHPA